MPIAYDTAGEIIKDAALELGLGTLTADPYGSLDPNIQQLCGLLKSGGRKLVFARDWTYLVAEYVFVTLPNWAANTVYTTDNGLDPWTGGFSVDPGHLIGNFGNMYRNVATSSGSTGTGLGPNTQTQGIVDGTAKWNFQCTGTSSIVVKGLYQYTCVNNGQGISGTTGPTGNVLNGVETDGTVQWQNTGLASSYPLPAGFSNMLDQTGWNRTTRLPLGNPVSAQQWQYLKGRQQGVVFNVLFRPDDDTIKLYPDTDTAGLQTIAFEYISRFWVSTVGSQQVTNADAPAKQTDIIFFDPLLMTRRLKLDWLQAKGFPSQAAKDDYETVLEQVMNADGTAPLKNLRGSFQFDPLLGTANIPNTGFGS